MTTKAVFAFVAFAAFWDTGTTVIGWFHDERLEEARR